MWKRGYKHNYWNTIKNKLTFIHFIFIIFFNNLLLFNYYYDNHFKWIFANLNPNRATMVIHGLMHVNMVIFIWFNIYIYNFNVRLTIFNKKISQIFSTYVWYHSAWSNWIILCRFLQLSWSFSIFAKFRTLMLHKTRFISSYSRLHSAILIMYKRH
jgi:hypothetical protein